MRYRPADGATGHESWGVSRLSLSPRLSARQRGQATLVHVYPTGLITLLPDHVEFYRLFPDGPGRIRLEKLVCVSPAARADPAFDAGMAQLVQGFLTIRDEDVAICRAVQRGLASRLARWIERRVGGRRGSQSSRDSTTTPRRR